jgi:hypothetical protein
MPLVVGLALVIVAATGTPTSARNPHRRRAPVTVIDVDANLAAFAGTVHGTVVLLHEVHEGDAVVAVRRREVALDGTTVSDVTTPLPPGFAWGAAGLFFNSFPSAMFATADVESDGSAALNAGTEVRLLATDGTLSEPRTPTHDARTVLLRGGFVHLLEPVAGSAFRTTYVWEGFRPDGTRVGPSEPLDPSAYVKALVDDQPLDTQDPAFIDAQIHAFDGRADGSAAVFVNTPVPPPAFPSSHSIWSEDWLYSIDATGTSHPVPGPEPQAVGSNTSDWDEHPRVHTAADGLAWNVVDVNEFSHRTVVSADGSPFGSDRQWADFTSYTASGVAADGRLIVLGLSDRPENGPVAHSRLAWMAFSVVPGAPPRVRTRRLRDAARGGAVERFVPRWNRCAAVSPDGWSLFACPASRADGEDVDSLFATLLDARGRAVRRIAIETPDYGRYWRGSTPKVVACGDAGFGVAWQEREGAVSPGLGPIKLALIRRR